MEILPSAPIDSESCESRFSHNQNYYDLTKNNQERQTSMILFEIEETFDRGALNLDNSDNNNNAHQVNDVLVRISCNF